MPLEQTFLFQSTPLDPQLLYPQVSRALEKCAELISRQKYPKMWELTDKLNRVEKVPQAVRENRRKRRGFLGLLNWLIGVFLLVPGLMEPQALMLPLIVGAVCFGSGVVTLWNNQRTLLGILGLVEGTALCTGAVTSFDGLGRLLILGITGIVIGLAALVTQKQGKESPFDRQARKLLQVKAAQTGMERMNLSFSAAGMSVGQEGGEGGLHTLEYPSFELVMETEELILPIVRGSMIILQKKDLVTGTIPALREFLSRQIRYETVSLPV